MTRIIGQISLLNDFGRTLAAVFVTSVIVYGLLPAETGPDLMSAIYWNIWATTYLGLTWFLILWSSPEQTRRWVSKQRALPRSRFSLLRSALLRVLQMLFLVGRTGSLFFYRIDKLDGLVAGHRPVAPGTRHTNSPGPARGRPEHVGGGDGLGGTSYFLLALLRFPLLPIRGICRWARFSWRAEPEAARLCLLCVYDRYEFCGL